MGQPKQWTRSDDILSPVDSAKVNIENGLTALYDTPVEQLTDGSFEDWSIVGYTPDGFDIDSMGATPIERSTDSYAGTYAALLTADAEFGGYISDILENEATFDSSETVQFTGYAKRVTGSADIAVIYSCDVGEDTYLYNFTGDNAGTWTIEGEGPTADQIETLTATSSYTQLTSTQATSPEGASEGYIMILGTSSNSGDTILLDNVEILIATVDEVVNGTFEDWTAVEELTYWESGDLDEGDVNLSKEEAVVYSGDYAVKMETYDGNHNYVAQLIEGTENDELTCSYYARGDGENAGTVDTTMFFLNNTLALADEVWNKTIEDWEEYTNFAGLDADNLIVLSIDTSETFTQDTATPTIPASGKVLQVVYGHSTNNDDLIYVDLASILKTEQGYGPLATVDSTTGKITFGAEIASSDATADGSTVNLGQLKQTGVVLLDSTTVDMTATTTYDLYTATENVMPLFITQRCATEDTITNPPTWSIGTNSADYNNYGDK